MMKITLNFEVIREYEIYMDPEEIRLNNKWKVGRFGQRAGLVKTDEFAKAQALLEQNIAMANADKGWTTPLKQPLILIVKWQTRKAVKRADWDENIHIIPKMDNDAIIKCVKDSLQGNKKDFPGGNTLVDDDWILAEYVYSEIVEAKEFPKTTLTLGKML